MCLRLCDAVTGSWGKRFLACAEARNRYAGRAMNAQLLFTLALGFLFAVSPNTPAAELAPQVTVNLGKGVKLEFVLIKPGTFVMGSGKRYGNTDEPAHEVTLTKPFYLGKFKVTQEQWEALVGDNPSETKNRPNAEMRPVDNVSWEDIVKKFIPKLAEKMPKGLTPRLPREAEWEYACRAGSRTLFCFGDNEVGLRDYGWYDKNSNWEAQPVGQKKPNAWGLYDMHGNMWEWCADWMGHYAEGKFTDPTGPAEGSLKVLHGGYAALSADRCRSSNRIGFASTYRGRCGFRIAASLEVKDR